MKVRHAAALALVGWYLMAPPAGFKNGQIGGEIVIDPTQPISDWSTVGSFDTARECQAGHDSWNAAIKEEAKTHRKRMSPWELLFEKNDSELAQCIATDDPRLKGY